MLICMYMPSAAALAIPSLACFNAPGSFLKASCVPSLIESMLAAIPSRPVFLSFSATVEVISVALVAIIG